MIRFATINDVELMAKIHVDTWLTTYKDIIPHKYLQKLSYSKSKTKFEKLIGENTNYHIVAEINKTIVGFASYGKERTDNYIYKGEIQAIYILEEFQRKGIGKQLFYEATKQLQKIGINNLMLWALELNNYTDFYLKLGGTIIDYKIVHFDSTPLREIAFAWDFNNVKNKNINTK